MASDFPLDEPPHQLNENRTPRPLREREKSAVREAITLVCTDGAGRLQGWLDRIDDGSKEGAKEAMGMFLKLLEFSMPKLQRVTVEDPDGNAPQLPIINVSFAQPMKVINPEDTVDG